jgi:hypothetical protein
MTDYEASVDGAKKKELLPNRRDEHYWHISIQEPDPPLRSGYLIHVLASTNHMNVIVGISSDRVHCPS